MTNNNNKFYYFNKLVRDTVHELFSRDGSVVSTRALDNDAEFKTALHKKVLEEVEELFTAQTRDEIIEEYADVQEVLQAIQNLYGISQTEIDVAQKLKQKDRGGYNKRFFLSVVCCQQGSRTQECALKNGYPEISQKEYDVYCEADKVHQEELK